ncbi:MAG TPA: T9SS type A sorting domain-containing protein, partial [Bacteroidales bacterium]|nr:T9SS type A sorting domain-containing protein [Bacteroidales bacterium]
DNFVPLKEPNASGSLANPTLKVFPNPAREQASIGFSMDRAGEAFLQVYDLSGRILLSDYMGNAVKGENVFILDMGRLQTGTYFVRVHDGVLPVGSGKLIVQ